jgi:hypothetical protein
MEPGVFATVYCDDGAEAHHQNLLDLPHTRFNLRQVA